MRRWLRRAPEPHAEWLHQQAVQRCARIDPELLAERVLAPPPRPAPTPLARALNLLAGVALRFCERFSPTDPVWAVIGTFSGGRLLAPPMIT